MKALLLHPPNKHNPTKTPKRYVMKYTLLSFFALILFSQSLTAQNDWTKALEPTFEGFLNDIHFVSDDEGWAVGGNGEIRFTRDGGLTWTDHSRQDFQDFVFLSVHFLDDQTGWIGTDQGSILKTTDGGQTWEEHSFQETVEHVDIDRLQRIQFLDSDTGYMLAGRVNNYYMFRSDNGGESWVVQDSLIDENWLDFDFIDEDRGVIVSNSPGGQVYTDDGGDTWNRSDSLEQVSNLTSLNAVRWIDENNIAVIGQGNAFQNLGTTAYYSQDGGATFEPSDFKDENTFAVFLGLEVLDNGDLIAVGHNRATRPVVARSSDNGVSWETELQDFSVNFETPFAVGEKIFVRGSSSTLFISEDSGNSFSLVPYAPYSEIRDFHFTDDGSGFALNSNSMLFSLDVENESFSLEGPALHNSPSRGNNLFFQDEMTGFIHKDNQHIVKTTDGGQNWDTVLEDLPNNFANNSGGITFTNDDTGYAWLTKNARDSHYIFKTSDGGETWEEQLNLTGPNGTSGALKFFDESRGFIAGPNRLIIRTEDGFESAEVDTVSSGFPEGFSESADFREVVIVDEETAWAVGNKFMVKTNNAGETWEWVDHGVAEIDSNFYALAIENEIAYAATFGGHIIYSEDGGQTWNKDDTFADERIFISAGIHDGRVYIGSTIGEIITTEHVVTSAEDDKLAGDKPESIRLEQNYPNPFNPSTQIAFEVPGTRHVTITVYNSLGQKVTVLADREFSAGTHEVTFDAAGISSGVYLYRLSTADTDITRSMMFVK